MTVHSRIAKGMSRLYLKCFFWITGDLLDEQRVLSWLTSQDVFEIKDEIEEVNRKMLDKLLDENEFVSVYFCKRTTHLCSGQGLS